MGSKPDELQVSYLRISSSGPGRVVFIITNTTKQSFFYGTGSLPATNGNKKIFAEAHTESSGMIGPNETTLFSIQVPKVSSWSPCVSYIEVSAKSLGFSRRHRLATWAEDHKWFRLSRWMKPKFQPKTIFGPSCSATSPRRWSASNGQGALSSARRDWAASSRLSSARPGAVRTPRPTVHCFLRALRETSLTYAALPRSACGANLRRSRCRSRARRRGCGWRRSGCCRIR